MTHPRQDPEQAEEVLMNKKVLLIEDDESIRENLTELLEALGYIVETAIDGQDALDNLKSSQNLPALILLDLMMPVMDGFQFRKIQELDPKISRIPVALMTAGGDIEAKSEMIRADAHLKKPFDLDQVIDTLERLCGRNPE